MPNPITQFKGQFKFLSNFAPAPVRLGGVVYPSVENAFQAAKTTDPAARKVFETCRPDEARAMGRRLKLREGWAEINRDVMRGAIKQKFKSGSPLAEQLLATGDAVLVEGNYHGDAHWGFSLQTGRGLNLLGVMLMERRAELMAERATQQVQEHAELFYFSAAGLGSEYVNEPLLEFMPPAPAPGVEPALLGAPAVASAHISTDTPPWL